MCIFLNFFLEGGVGRRKKDHQNIGRLYSVQYKHDIITIYNIIRYNIMSVCSVGNVIVVLCV